MADMEPQRSERSNDMMTDLPTALAFGSLAYSNRLFSFLLKKYIVY